MPQHRRHKYGIEQNQYDHLVAEQGGLCAICRERPAEHLDHDHGTGAVRGVLCRTCNTGLGMFGDDPETISRAADYAANSRPVLPEPVKVFKRVGKPHVCGERNRCPGEAELRRMYVEENWLLAKIGAVLDVPPPSIYRYLEAHGVERRGNTGRGGRPTRVHECGRDNSCPGERALRDMYHVRGLPVAECVSALGLKTASAFYTYLRAHDIERRAEWARERAAS